METETTFLNRLQYDLFWIALRTDGIIKVQLKGNDEVDVDQIKNIVEAIKLIGAGNIHPILIVAGEFTLPSHAARAYLATAESDPYASAEAYVIRSFPQKLVGNFYLSFNKPARPTRIFTSEDKAIDWLKSF
ncbi:MAG: hypothetical protein M3R27_10740 [Bacteroidota bacterium]|nr:hypothetical protein [Bacteroidota bacterium]